LSVQGRNPEIHLKVPVTILNGAQEFGMDRRRFVVRSGAVALALTQFVTRIPWASAQSTDAFDELGLPELTVTLTDEGFTADPTELSAGWTLVTFDNTTSSGAGGPNIMLVPPDLTKTSLLDLLLTPTAESPRAWVATSVFAGGPYCQAGEKAQTVINLSEGDWAVWSGFGTYNGAIVTVTGDAEAVAQPEVSAALTAAVEESALVGFPPALQPGPGIWAITNTASDPHMVMSYQLPDGTSLDTFADSITRQLGGTPTADTVDLDKAPVVGVCTLLSSDQTVFVSLDLATGTYGVVTYAPSHETGESVGISAGVTVFNVR
jgi:hypothetical protein